MIMTTTSTNGKTVGYIFEALQAAGVQAILFNDNTEICCAGDAGSSADILIQRESLPLFTRVLASHGFYRMATTQFASSVFNTTYLGYCDHCAALVRFNVSTEITVGNLAGNYLVLRQTNGVFDCVMQVGAAQTTRVLEAISYVCAASLLYEYQTRSRRNLLAQAREAFQQCDTDLFHSTAESLVGAEATSHIHKILQTFVAWEIDLLLQELWRVLESASEVDYNPGRLLARKGHPTPSNKLALSCTRARIRKAPVVVVTDTSADSQHANELCQLLGSMIECRMLRFRSAEPIRCKVQAEHTINAVKPGVRLVCSALITAFRNTRQFRKIRALADKGITVIVPGFPVVDFPDLFNVPRLKSFANHKNPLYRVTARWERRLYEVISAANVDCLLVLPAAIASGEASFESRRRSQAIAHIPVNAACKKLIKASGSSQTIQAQMINHVLKVASDT